MWIESHYLHVAGLTRAIVIPGLHSKVRYHGKTTHVFSLLMKRNRIRSCYRNHLFSFLHSWICLKNAVISLTTVMQISSHLPMIANVSSEDLVLHGEGLCFWSSRLSLPFVQESVRSKKWVSFQKHCFKESMSL